MRGEKGGGERENMGGGWVGREERGESSTLKHDFDSQSHKETNVAAYKALVRPQLEYAAPIWNPHHQSEINRIEKVQRTALFDYQCPPRGVPIPLKCFILLLPLKRNLISNVPCSIKLSLFQPV